MFKKIYAILLLVMVLCTSNNFYAQQQNAELSASESANAWYIKRALYGSAALVTGFVTYRYAIKPGINSLVRRYTGWLPVTRDYFDKAQQQIVEQHKKLHAQHEEIKSVQEQMQRHSKQAHERTHQSIKHVEDKVGDANQNIAVLIGETQKYGVKIDGLGKQNTEMQKMIAGIGDSNIAIQRDQKALTAAQSRMAASLGKIENNIGNVAEDVHHIRQDKSRAPSITVNLITDNPDVVDKAVQAMYRLGNNSCVLNLPKGSDNITCTFDAAAIRNRAHVIHPSLSLPRNAILALNPWMSGMPGFPVSTPGTINGRLKKLKKEHPSMLTLKHLGTMS